MDGLTNYEAEAVKQIAYHRKGLEGAIRDAFDNGLMVSGEIIFETDELIVAGGVSIFIDVSKPIDLPE